MINFTSRKNGGYNCPCFVLLICILLFVCSFLFSATVNAQGPRQRVKKCGDGVSLQEVLADPVAARRYAEGISKTRQYLLRPQQSLAYDMNKVYKIPVVFHIVGPNPNLITNAMVQYQIAVLNRDYAGINVDSINAAGFYNARGHVKFVFELAKRSPEGCDTNGITRTVSNTVFTSAGIGQIKYNSTGGHDAWDSYNCKYLNIWVGFASGGLLGKATFPFTNVPPQEQGVFTGFNTFMNNPALGAFTYGRTLVHEVGHYFGLFHIWGDEAGCATDDSITDTPMQDDQTTGRPVAPLFDICSPAATVKGINFQNYMDYCDDTVLTMFTKLQDSVMVASLHVYSNRSFLISSKNKALSAKEENQLFTQCNTPAFTTNSFTCVGVGYNGVVWAGSSQAGLYNYYGGQWRQYGTYINNLYQDIKADRDGGIWVAQSGYNGAQAQTGGVLYFPDSVFPASPNYYSALAGLPSRYPRSIFVDTNRVNVGQGGSLNPLVWTANFATVTAGISSNGGLGRGFDPVAPNFISIRDGLEPADVNGGTASCYVLGGNSAEILVATQNNFGMSQLLRYNALTNEFIGTYDTTNALSGFGLATNFVTRAIYFDKRGRKWVSVNGTGLLVHDTDNVWKKISYPKIFPSSPFFNNNALTGDTSGNVYIGTTSGIIVYTAGKPLNKDSAFTLYSTSNGLPSNNIKGIAIDTMRQKIILATDAGVIFWNPVCAGGPAIDNETFSTTATGDWNNPAIWCNGVVPPPNAKIIVRHPVTITTDTNCKSLQIVLPGSFTVNPGINLNVGN
jgi:hypothetical protein